MKRTRMPSSTSIKHASITSARPIWRPPSCRWAVTQCPACPQLVSTRRPPTSLLTLSRRFSYLSSPHSSDIFHTLSLISFLTLASCFSCTIFLFLAFFYPSLSLSCCLFSSRSLPSPFMFLSVNGAAVCSAARDTHTATQSGWT